MPTAINDGVGISYEVTGRGRPLMLIHGWLNDRSWWSETGYFDELGRDHRLINVDMRGHGLSDRPHDPSAYRAACFAGDVLAVAVAEGLDGFAFWGLSYGGWAAWVSADAAPGRVAAIIATGSWDPRPSPYVEGVTPEDPDLEVLRRGGLAAVVDLYEDETFRFPPAVRAVMLGADPEAMIASQAAELASEGVRDIDSFAVPALLIAGELEDPGGEATVIAGRLPHGESLILPGLGHAAACAASTLTIRTARAFLDRWFAQPG